MKTDKTKEELEDLCLELELKVRKTKDLLKEISKFLNKKIKDI